MKGSIATLAAATAFAGTASGLQYVKRENPRAVHVPFERAEPSPALKERMRLRRRAQMVKRQSKTVSETIDNFEDGSLYFANVTLGTPGQKLRFHVDTGSSDLWANSATSPYCQQSNQAIINEGGIPCSVSGTYSSSSSSTYKYINDEFFIQYADTTGASGDYVSDVLTIGGTTVQHQQFGIGLQSNSSEGVMGIGYPSLEVAVQNDGGSAYPNIPQNMVQQGLINTPSYSLWLDALNSTSGNLLFGGVDTAKFTGPLVTVPIVPEQGMYLEMIVGLSGISVTNNGKTSAVDTQAVPVLLDSGSTLMYLPSAVAMSIYSAVGATYRSSQGVATCSCSLGQNTNEYLTFNFSGQNITVALSQLVLQEGRTCLFGIVPQDTAPFTLGDTFIRNAYLVYDLNANTISIAQTKFNTDSQSDVHEITNGTSGVPSAVAATATAQVTLDGQGQRYNGGVPTGATNLGNAGTHPTAAAMAWGAAAAGAAGMMMAAM